MAGRRHRAAMREHIGQVTVPTGTLVVFDCGAYALVSSGAIPRPQEVRVEGLPHDRALEVVGARVGEGDFADCWDHLRVVVREDAAVARAEEAGAVIVDFARLLFADSAIGDHWRHEDAIDGRADFIFWGRDAEALARELLAPRWPDEPGTYGWVDRPIDEIVMLGTQAEETMAARGWKLATDFRPHSHHYRALSLARASSTGSGTIDVAHLRVCLAFTSWGDGVFPVLRELDARGDLIGVRVQLRTAETEAVMREVNRLG